MQKTVVLATNNQGKLNELSAMLSAWQVKPQGEFFTEEAVEDGLSFIENAIIKARFAAAKTGLPAIADDSGLEVDVLGGAPGIFSSRYAQEFYPNEPKSDARNIEVLLEKMAEFSGEQRLANFYCAMVFVRNAQDPTPIIGLGKWQGRILEAPKGEQGFGYDPVFYVPEFDCAAAELAADVKNKISHRAKALAELVRQL